MTFSYLKSNLKLDSSEEYEVTEGKYKYKASLRHQLVMSLFFLQILIAFWGFYGKMNGIEGVYPLNIINVHK